MYINIVRLLITILLISLSTKIIGQQRPLFSQYMYNKYYENPGYGGLDRSLSATLSYRDQYYQLPGNPKTFFVGAHMPLYILNGAAGFMLFNQSSGLFRNTGFKASYNQIFSTPYGLLSVGGRIGLEFLTLDGVGIITPGGNYEGVFSHNDPSLNVDNMVNFSPSWEAGVYFLSAQYQIGMNISQWPNFTSSLDPGRFKRRWSGSIYGQYTFDIMDEYRLMPSCMISVDQAVIQTDIALNTIFNESLFGGIGLRGYSNTSFDAVYIIIGTNMGKNYKISYSYDIGISDLNLVEQGSHEIVLRYNLNKLIGIGLPPKVIYNPRDL